MKVFDTDSAAIILTLLDELHIHTNGKIEVETLQQHWAKIGLRLADLEIGLARLVLEESLHEYQADTAAYYQLTEAGNARMSKLNSPFSFGLESHQRLRRTSSRRLEDRKAEHVRIMEERRASYSRVTTQL